MTTINVGIVGSAVAISRLGSPEGVGWGLVLLFLAGLLLTVLGMFVLFRQRRTFLDIVVTKTILENVLGLEREIQVEETLHALRFPWRYDELTRKKILQKPQDFRRGFKYIIMPGTITFTLFMMYVVFLVLNGAGLYLSWSGLI